MLTSFCNEPPIPFKNKYLAIRRGQPVFLACSMHFCRADAGPILVREEAREKPIKFCG
jgi:hypothetical protein